MPAYQRVIQHSTGKYVVADIVDSDSDQIHIYVYSSLGSLLADIDTNIASIQGGIATIEYDSDEILLCYGYEGGAKWVRVNIVSFSLGTTYTSHVATSGGAETNTCLSNLLYSATANKYFVEVGVNAYYGGANFAVAYYDGATTAGISVEMSSCAADNLSVTYGYLDEVAQHIYFQAYRGGTFYIHDFYITTPAMIEIATCPFSGGAPSSDEKTYGYFNYFNFYQMSKYVDGTNIYLYSSWSKSSRTGTWTGGSPIPGTRFQTTYLWYIKFNNTISSATILQNTLISDTQYDSSGSGSLTLGISCGYLFRNPVSPTFEINTYYQNIAGGKNIAKATYRITDIATDPTSFDSIQILTGVDDLEFDFISYDSAVSMNPTYGWSYHAISKTDCRLSIGGLILSRVYTVTDSISPLDNPLLTNKNYDITFSIYVNGVLDNLGDKYTLSINGVERGGGDIPISGASTGKIVFGMTVINSGDYDIIIKMYDSNNNYLASSEVFTYTFSTYTPTTNDDETSAIITSGVLFIVNYLPAMLVIFGTGTSFAGVAKGTGNGQYSLVMWFSGCVLGCILGGMLGVVPSSVMLLGIFMFAVLAVFVFKTGSSGGQ